MIELMKKKVMTKERLHFLFMDYAAHEYNALGYIWQFSTWKRLSMDRSSYLRLAEEYFEKNYSPKLLENEDDLVILINAFNRDVEILEPIEKQ